MRSQNEFRVDFSLRMIIHSDLGAEIVLTQVEYLRPKAENSELFLSYLTTKSILYSKTETRIINGTY